MISIINMLQYQLLKEQFGVFLGLPRRPFFFLILPFRNQPKQILRHFLYFWVSFLHKHSQKEHLNQMAEADLEAHLLNDVFQNIQKIYWLLEFNC